MSLESSTAATELRARLTRLMQRVAAARASIGADAVCWALGALGAAVWLRILFEGAGLTLSHLDNCPQWCCDFARCYLPEAQELGRRSYRLAYGWHYPPLLAIALLPLRHLQTEPAAAIWTIVNVGAAVALAALCAAELPGRSRWARWAGGLGMVAISLPVVHGIKWGQVSTVLCALCAWGLARRNRWTGPLIGVAVATKMYPAAYLLAPAIRRELRPLIWAGATTAGVGVLFPLVFLGWRRCHAFAVELFGVFEQPLSWLGAQGIGSSLTRWFVDGRHISLEGSPGALIAQVGSAPVIRVVGYALAVGVVALASWRIWKQGHDAALGGALCLVALTIALEPSWHHYFSFLPFAQAVALRRAGDRPRAFWLALGSTLLASLPIVLLADNPIGYFVYSQWGGTTLAALMCLAALVMVRGEPAAGSRPDAV